MKSKPQDFNESNEYKSILEQKFSEFLTEKDPPEELKGEVFNSLNSLMLLGDLTDLFTVKFAKTNFNLISPSNDEMGTEPLGEERKK